MSEPAPVLVIGVGSELRGDDAAGRRVADTVGALAPAGVDVRSVHQLTPELAEEVAGRRLVLVVDASVDVEEITIRAVPQRGGATGVLTHHLDPAALIGLSTLFGPEPAQVVVIGVPAHDLGVGLDLSAATLEAIEDAVVEVLERCWLALAPPVGLDLP